MKPPTQQMPASGMRMYERYLLEMNEKISGLT
jgi:hypothetical protein